jgi:hypothetical protein
MPAGIELELQPQQRRLPGNESVVTRDQVDCEVLGLHRRSMFDGWQRNCNRE